VIVSLLEAHVSMIVAEKIYSLFEEAGPLTIVQIALN